MRTHICSLDVDLTFLVLLYNVSIKKNTPKNAGNKIIRNLSNRSDLHVPRGDRTLCSGFPMNAVSLTWT